MMVLLACCILEGLSEKHGSGAVAMVAVVVRVDSGPGGRGGQSGDLWCAGIMGSRAKAQLHSYSPFLCPSGQMQPKRMRLHSRKPSVSPVLLTADLLPPCMY